MKILNLSGRYDLSCVALSIKDGSRKIVLRKRTACAFIKYNGGFPLASLPHRDYNVIKNFCINSARFNF